MEEDIKILRDFINEHIDVNFKNHTALNNILTEREADKKRIKELEEEINICKNRIAEKQTIINKLETVAGLALRAKPLEITKKALRELDNTIKIEQTENIINDSYIFRAI